MIPPCDGSVKVKECVEEAGCKGLVGVRGRDSIHIRQVVRVVGVIVMQVQ